MLTLSKPARTNTFRTLAAGVVFGASLLVLPSASFAQPGTDAPVISPPNPTKADNPPTLIMIGFGVLLLGAIFATNVMPSGRGHQD
jgi:hypothetical protein